MTKYYVSTRGGSRFCSLAGIGESGEASTCSCIEEDNFLRVTFITDQTFLLIRPESYWSLWSPMVLNDWRSMKNPLRPVFIRPIEHGHRCPSPEMKTKPAAKGLGAAPCFPDPSGTSSASRLRPQLLLLNPRAVSIGHGKVAAAVVESS